ncbi:class A beta-lactamase [Rhodanobacter sp. C01]|uniref:class A beta-lactamase n=1 Tax=Rhodanobacter sp. C01 TaxID=1945856 RepID=UPI0009857873|nr:class A beta-lactamase [Rhodanobacter sp. C01]OOG49056.1 class A beta-lactamase [Rhodanobacter sp. C01]
MNRRNFFKGATAVAAALVLRPALSFDASAETAVTRLAALERKYGGRLGVSILDTGSGRRAVHRADERFLMCSTFKLLAVASVLARVDRGAEQLDRRIVFGKESVLAWAPVTSHRTGGQGMSVAELCEAAITVSDNTAANLLLASLGGPATVTAYARGLGDPLTRLDRIEPELNTGGPGDVRDTTTPNAMLADLRTLLLGDALSMASRRQLVEWLRATRTGVDKLRAGVPGDWQVGDKTGSGAHGESNDIAIIWPPQRKPLLVTAYYAAWPADSAGHDAVLAEVGRIAASI